MMQIQSKAHYNFARSIFRETKINKRENEMIQTLTTEC